MDPALQEQLQLQPADEEIEALIRLRDEKKTPGKIKLISQFGDIITCRVRRRDILEVYHGGEIISFKASRLLTGDVYETEEIGEAINLAATNPHWLEEAHRIATGKGVVIGVIDWGADFAHEDFVNPDGSTRFLAIWNQADETRPNLSPSYGYGRVFSQEEINSALATPTPYQTLGYHPGYYTPRGGSHGTHVAGIAAGNGRSGVKGIAPQADIVFVHLASKDISPELNLGDSVRLLEAIDFIQKVAAGRPLAINISVGRHGGSHDGLSLVEMAMDNFLSNRFNTIICQSTGNYFETNTHSSGIVYPGRKRVFSFQIDKEDVTPNEIEIWYPGKDVFDCSLKHNDSGISYTCSIRQNKTILLNGENIGHIYHRANEPNNGKNHINIFIYTNAPKGKWEIELRGRKVVDGRYHAWIERDSGCKKCQSRFEEQYVDPFYTTGTICNGFNTIVVGAVDDTGTRIAPFSSSGPTADGRLKPNILADGMNIIAARSAPRTAKRGGNGLVKMSGTSMAAPQVTGAAALLLEAGSKLLNCTEIRTILLQSARFFSAERASRHRVGNGVLDAFEALKYMNRIKKNIAMQASTESILPEQIFGISSIPFGRVFISQGNSMGYTLRSKRLMPDRTYSTLDEALTFAHSLQSQSSIIIGELHTGNSFLVYELDMNVSLVTPLVIRTQWTIPNVCALVIEPLTTYMPANMVNISDRWIQMPRLGDYYSYPAQFQLAQMNAWRSLLRPHLAQIRIPGVTVNESWLNSRSTPVLRLLVANFAPIIYAINANGNRGVVMNGSTTPVFKTPLSEPDFANAVISRVEGKMESINAWDHMAGISIGPIQINTIDGYLHRFLWDVWEQDRDLFNVAFRDPLSWTMRSGNGRVFLSVFDNNQNRVEIADNQYLQACGYLMTGNPNVSCQAGNPVFDVAFRRQLTERFRQLLVWPHIQELVFQASNRYLTTGLNIIHRANSGISPLNSRNPDRDTFILKALLLSFHVRFSAYTARIVTHLQQFPNVSDKLANLSQALSSQVSNQSHRQELERRLQRQQPVAGEIFQMVQARLRQLSAGTPIVQQAASGGNSDAGMEYTSPELFADDSTPDIPNIEEHTPFCECEMCAPRDAWMEDAPGKLDEAIFQTATPYRYSPAASIRNQLDCSPPPSFPYLPTVTQFPNIVNNPDALVEQAFLSRGITQSDIRRFRSRGGFEPLLPIAQHFGEAFSELLDQLRYPNEWILNPRVSDGNSDIARGRTEPYLAPRLLLAIPGFFRELARRTTNHYEAYGLESMGWFLMYRLRDMVNQSTGNNWWLPPMPAFAQALPANSLTYVSSYITDYAYNLSLFRYDVTPNAFNRNANTWRSGLAGQHWQAETGQIQGQTPGLLFYPDLVNIPAAVNTQTQRQQINTAWQERLSQVDQQFPIPADASPQELSRIQEQRAQALTDRNQGNPATIRSLFSRASLGDLRLTYAFPQLVQSRNPPIRTQVTVLTVLVPIVEAIFRTIHALGWNDLLFQTMGSQLFRGIASSRNRGENRDDYIQRAYRRSRQISNHAYGLALDLNVIENPQESGAHAAMSLRIVALFKAFGYYWGYCFGANNIDGHHFEYRGNPYVPQSWTSSGISAVPTIPAGHNSSSGREEFENESSCECGPDGNGLHGWNPEADNLLWDDGIEASDCIPVEDSMESIPASQLNWAGATPVQLDFMRRVYELCVQISSRRGTFVNDIASGQLQLIENGHSARTDAAQACISLLAAAREAIRINAIQANVGISSGYRSASRQFQLWQNNFPRYYRETQSHRQGLSGGEHGAQSAEYLASFIRRILATPGYSNHNNGLAVDLFTTENGRTLSANRAHITAWRQSWFWGWLTSQAAGFGYYQNLQIDEPWHWEYRI